MHTVVISDFQALLNLKKAWLALMEQSAWCSVFSSPEWNYSWWRVYGNGKQLCVWTLWSSPENLAGIYPLFMEKKQGVRWLCPLGYPRHADTSGLVADSTRTMDVHAAFFSWLGSQGGWDVARLSNVPVESLPDQQSSAMWQGTTEDMWSGFARKAGLKSKTVPAEPCMIIPLRDSNFMDDRPGKVEFHTCKRKLKELNRHFRDAAVNHTPLDQACIDEVVKLSAEKSKAYREGKSFFNAPGAETFMRDMAGHEQQSFSLRLFTLHLNDAHPAGAHGAQILVVAQVRNIDSGVQRAFQQVFSVRHRERGTVDFDVRHNRTPPFRGPLMQNARPRPFLPIGAPPPSPAARGAPAQALRSALPRR